MDFVIRHEGATRRVELSTQLSVRNRQALKQAIVEEIENGALTWVIDFARTESIDSSGLGLLVSLNKAIRQRGGELTLTNVRSELRKLFRLTRVDAHFRIDEDPDDGGSAGRSAPLHPRVPDPLFDAAEARPDQPPPNPPPA
jgi:anti-anti-sigma factor